MAASATAENIRGCSCGLQQLAHAPNVIGDASLRSRCAAKGLALALAALPKLAAFRTAVVARHSGLELSSGWSDNGRGVRNPTLDFGLRLTPLAGANCWRGLVLPGSLSETAKTHFFSRVGGGILTCFLAASSAQTYPVLLSMTYGLISPCVSIREIT